MQQVTANATRKRSIRHRCNGAHVAGGDGAAFRPVYRQRIQGDPGNWWPAGHWGRDARICRYTRGLELILEAGDARGGTFGGVASREPNLRQCYLHSGPVVRAACILPRLRDEGPTFVDVGFCDAEICVATARGVRTGMLGGVWLADAIMSGSVLWSKLYTVSGKIRSIGSGVEDVGLCM